MIPAEQYFSLFQYILQYVRFINNLCCDFHDIKLLVCKKKKKIECSVL